MHEFTASELYILKRLNTPAKIQDFLNAMPLNQEEKGDTCMSPRKVLQEGKAHCMEGAMLAAVALRLQKRPPLVLDLTSTADDHDHVVAIFKENGSFGAISKTNHTMLRYREPIYKTIRELAMSYFHEYYLEDGRKTLRSYSRPIDLSRFDKEEWMTSEDDVWYIPEYLADVSHIPILTRSQMMKLRRADKIERRALEIVEWEYKR